MAQLLRIRHSRDSTANCARRDRRASAAIHPTQHQLSFPKEAEEMVEAPNERMVILGEIRSHPVAERLLRG